MNVGVVLPLMVVVLLGGCTHALVLRMDWFPGLARVPLDLGRAIRGRRVFGANKTFRGLAVMVGGTAGWALVIFPRWPPGPDRSPLAWAGVGASLGLAYIVAELPNSFVKRRLGIAPGQEASVLQRFIDEADSVIGVTLAAAALLPLSGWDAVVLVVSGTALHLLVDVALHLGGVKRSRSSPRSTPT